MSDKSNNQLGAGGTFIIGPARCGSTLVSNILNLHPEVLSISEFLASHCLDCLLPGKLTGRDYWQRLSKSSPLLRLMITRETMPGEFLYQPEMGRFQIDDVPPILKMTLPHISNSPESLFDSLAISIPKFPKQTTEAHHAMLFEHLLKICGGKIWVERSGMSLMYVRVLPRLFPAAKFVMICRDGRDVALSLQSFKPARAIIWIWSKLRKLGINPLNLDSPMGRSSKYKSFAEFPDNRNFFISKWPAKWMLENPPPLKACADFWSQMTLQSLLEFQKLDTDKRYYLSYENLIENPALQLEDLVNFLGVDSDKDWLTKSITMPKQLKPRWKQLNPAEQNKLTEWTKLAQTALNKEIYLK
tara:strand:+ start:85552 stop:86625 length:1074 start_codon:yes stop_codon:yes gene_type:complete